MLFLFSVTLLSLLAVRLPPPPPLAAAAAAADDDDDDDDDTVGAPSPALDNPTRGTKNDEEDDEDNDEKRGQTR